MPTTATLVGEITKKALERFGSKWPSKSIAAWLVKKHPKIFKDVEQARGNIRYYRGACGRANREKYPKKFKRNFGTQSDGFIPLPDGIEDLKKWEIVSADFKIALLLSDIHIPFHDPMALELAIDEGRRRKVDCIILNGDVVDFYSVSFWEKNPELRDLNGEIQKTRLFLEHLREKFPKARIIYKEGNHEERVWRYAWRNCPDLYSITNRDGQPVLSLGSLMDANEYGVEIVDNRQPILCEKHLYILHGHEFKTPFVNPVNPARGLSLRTKCNAVCGDLHQTSNHVEPGLSHTFSCWSTGCLCDLHPSYMPLNKWNQGFGIINLSGIQWSFENLKIINGQIVSA